MNLYVGTSGYAYKPWKGTFYPKGLPDKEMLRYYSGRFRAVEVNSSFYAMPKEASLAAWASQVPAGFRFTFKAPQRITHFQRLKNSVESVELFLRVTATLGERLGPLLFGLPPNLKADLPRLREFLGLIPPGRRVSFEFRNQTWLEPPVLEVLRERGVALCIAEDEDGVRVPREATAGWGYIRLRCGDNTDEQLKEWAAWVKAQAWSDVYVFLKHEDEGKGPRFAERFLGFMQ